MTAIALAESSGNSDARNDSGEHSQGLWQINRDAHDSWLGSSNLFDPRVNASAAWEVSQHGATMEPWTVTHKGSEARYLQFREQAQDAAVANGDPPNLGVWSGTQGYGYDVPTGEPGDGSTPNDNGGPAGGAGSGSGDSDGVDTFVDAAVAQTGDSYVFGHEVDLNDTDPAVFDCSELVQWAAHQAGVDITDGSWNQYLSLQEKGATISVDQALHTRGALLFNFSSAPTDGSGRPDEAHVAISLGNGQTIEARGTSYGVGSWEANTDRFNYAAVIPELGSAGAGSNHSADDAASTTNTPVAPADDGTDADADGLTAKLERMLGTDPDRLDTDSDGISDSYEVSHLKSNPLSADTDNDSRPDGVELASGSNPLVSDNPDDTSQDDAAPVAPSNDPDSDSDRLSDRLEALLKTDPHVADSDSDGYSDGWEYSSGFDPNDPASHPVVAATDVADDPVGTLQPLDDLTADAEVGA